ncbi:MAG: aldolase/citrate lyase family protein [Candidatus Hydrogenedentota bacterium]
MINRLKKKLQGNRLTIGSWITLGDTSVAEIMADAGFEWLVIDMEHSVIDYGLCQNLISVIESKKCVPLVRVGANDPLIIKRVMDAGAYGVIVPMVNNRDDAEKAVKSVKYPPIGTRGVGLYRAQGYGTRFTEYAKFINSNSIVIVQIEHIEAVENLEEILGVEGIDGCIIGPYDLSGSMGIPGKFNHPKMKKNIVKIESVCKRMKKVLGMHIIKPDIKEAIIKIKRGYSFIAFSLDFYFLGESCRNHLKELRKSYN